jgi:signal transduction histidine kinase
MPMWNTVPGMALRRWADPAFAVGLTLVALARAVTSPPGRSSLDALGVALLVVCGSATAARRRAPLPVLAVTVAAALAYELLGYPGLAPLTPVLVALFTAAGAGRRRPALIAAAVTVSGGLVDQLVRGGVPGDTGREITQRWFLVIGWLLAAVVGGKLAAQHRAYLAAVEQRAEQAERTREEAARRRADEERLRIARELHDSLTHSISIIKVQAGVAIHLARKRDEVVPGALLAIEQAGGEAMRELRATLEVLRGDEETGSGLDRLDHLVEGARQAGLPIRVDVTGDRREVPAPVGRAAYRIIQEALTNVRRHAGPTATASVRLGYHTGELTVRVDDDGPGTPGPEDSGTGVGLRGMRERVAALGGSLEAGPADGGGFRVHARIPLAAS